jgi:hypothetical protein
MAQGRLKHTDQLLAVDFFVSDTVWLTPLYLLLFLEWAAVLGSSRVGRRHPIVDWLLRSATVLNIRGRRYRIRDAKTEPRARTGGNGRD